MAKTTAKTTIEFNGVNYPFYRTIRGQWDFENAGFENKDMAAGKTTAMFAYIFFQLRDCAKRAGFEFRYSLDQFIDLATGEELAVYGRLVEAEKELKEREGKEPGKSQTEEAEVTR
jgi:hypothetical protein